MYVTMLGTGGALADPDRAQSSILVTLDNGVRYMFDCGAATVANTEPMKTGFAAVRFGWSAYVIPFLFVVSPALLMNAGPLEILIAGAAAVAGIWAVSVGLAGQLFAFLGMPLRALFIAAGLALLVPGTLFDEAPMMNIAGAALVMVLIVAGNLQRKRRQG